MGRMAWNFRLRPCLAEPPAESPSTMNNSALAGSRSWQSASLPGNEETSSAPLRRVSSRALRAASRAAAASTTLPTIVLASAGWISNQSCSAWLITFSTTGRTSEETSLSLVWEENFGSGTLHDSTAVRPSRQSSPVSDTFSLREEPIVSILRDLTRERAAKTREMRAAVALRDIVGEAQHGLVIGVVPPQRALDRDPLALGLDHDGGGNERRLVSVEEAHECLDAALVFHLLPLLHRVALIGKDDGDTGIEEGELAQPMLECREIELDHAEGFVRRKEGDLRAASSLGVADDLERGKRDPVAELHEMLLAVAPDCE